MSENKHLEVEFERKKAESLYNEMVFNPEKRQFAMHVIDKDLHIPDPHEIILSYFEVSNVNMLTAGTATRFKWVAFFFLIGMLILKLLSTGLFPNIFEILLVLIALAIVIELLSRAMQLLNRYSQKSLPSMFALFGVMAVLIVIVGNI